MGGWRGLLQPLLRGHKVRNKGFSTYPRPLPPTMARHIQPAESCRSVGYPACSRLLYSNVVRRFCTSKGKADGKEGPVRSPLTMVPSLTDDKDKKTLTQAVEKRPVQAVLKKIKQSPKKVNLVAALVRGMRVEDAILQLTVLRKRAAKTVKRVVANARANATHNHGLNGDKLFVDEAFVGKGRYLKRISYHAKGRSGIMHHPSCRLTVIVKELTDKQEAELARYKTMHFRERAKFRSRLVPHKLIETSSYWDRIPKGQPGNVEAATPT